MLRRAKNISVLLESIMDKLFRNVICDSAGIATPKRMASGLLVFGLAGALAGIAPQAHATFVTENLYSAGVTNIGTEVSSLAPGNYIFGGVNFDLTGGNYGLPYGLSGGSNAVSPVAGVWSGQEAQDLNSNSQETMTISPDQYGVTSVYTLINTDWGTTAQYIPNTSTPYAEVIFTATGGLSDTVDLIGGNQMRDWNNDGYPDTTSSSYTTDGVFTQSPDALGSSGRVDMQQFVLPSQFATQTLNSIEFVDNGSNNTQHIVVTGVTLATNAVPEPTTLGLAAMGMLGLGFLRLRRSHFRRA